MDAHFKQLSDAAHMRLRRHKSSSYSRYGKNGPPDEAAKVAAQTVRGPGTQGVVNVPKKRAAKKTAAKADPAANQAAEPKPKRVAPKKTAAKRTKEV